MCYGLPPQTVQLGVPRGHYWGQVFPPVVEWEMSIWINGSLVDSCAGGELADNVVRSLRWLAGELPRHGLSLRPAQTVLTGSLMGLIPIAPDSHVLVDAGRLGTAEIEVCR